MTVSSETEAVHPVDRAYIRYALFKAEIRLVRENSKNVFLRHDNFQLYKNINISRL